MGFHNFGTPVKVWAKYPWQLQWVRLTGGVDLVNGSGIGNMNIELAHILSCTHRREPL